MRASVAVSFLLWALVAGPAIAATRRAVQPVATISFTYNLYDSITGHPVISAEVRSGTQLAITDAQGGFTLSVLNGRPTMVTVHRTGYADLTFNVTFPFGTTAIPPVTSSPVITFPNVTPPAPPMQPQTGIPLLPLATVVVQLSNGQTVHLDTDSVQFAYVLPFETPQGSNGASLCKNDGTAWTPDRAEFAQITGPATSVTNSACCKLGPLLAIDVKMKSGDSARVTFADSCFGYDIDFVGRDHESAQYVYFNFKDVALITFP